MSKRSSKRPKLVRTVVEFRCRTLPLATEVDLGKGLDPWGFARKLKYYETVHMVDEEQDVLNLISEQQPAKLWAMLNAIGRKAGIHKYQSRSSRQRLIPLVTRLVKEGKIIRHRATNTFTLGPNYHKSKPCATEVGPDFGSCVRDVLSVDCVA
jgi:hypothetical protein